jgi:hypothetical protein
MGPARLMLGKYQFGIQNERAPLAFVMAYRLNLDNQLPDLDVTTDNPIERSRPDDFVGPTGTVPREMTQAPLSGQATRLNRTELIHIVDSNA